MLRWLIVAGQAWWLAAMGLLPPLPPPLLLPLLPQLLLLLLLLRLPPLLLLLPQLPSCPLQLQLQLCRVSPRGAALHSAGALLSRQGNVPRCLWLAVVPALRRWWARLLRPALGAPGHG
jgi:hypothetical protein